MIEAGAVERVQADNREHVEASRRRVGEYRERNRFAPVAGQTRAGAGGQPGRLQRTRLRAAVAERAASGFAPGGENIAARFSEAPLHAVAEMFAALTTSNIVVAGEIAAATVTLHIARAPWRDALSAIAQTQGWVVRDDAGFIRIRRLRDEDDARTATTAASHGVDLLRFFHIAPDDMKKAAMPLFAGAAHKPVMSVDERTGSLVVKGTPDDVALIAALAGKLDRPVRQILIETFIVEAGRGLERSLGARLGITRFDVGGAVRVGGVLGAGAGEQTAVNLPVTAPAAGIGFLFNSDRLKLELTALEKEGKTRIVSNPRIFTLNGREAVIFQGDEVPYFSVSENGTQTEFKEAGVRLAVTPVITGNGDLILDVTVNKDTVDTRVQNPPITRRQIKTKLLVADGAMVVIGGIYFDTQVSAETRVPVLGRLPLIGRLFKRSQNTRDFKELLVFIAPKIVEVSS